MRTNVSSSIYFILADNFQEITSLSFHKNREDMKKKLSYASVMLGALMSNIHVYYSKQFNISYKHVFICFVALRPKSTPKVMV